MLAKPIRFAIATALGATLLASPAIIAFDVAPAFAKVGSSKKKKSEKTVVKKGTEFTVKLDDDLDSGSNKDGDTFSAPVATGMIFGDKTLKGFVLNGHVEGIKSAKMGGKKGEMNIVLDEVVAPDGEVYPIDAELSKVPKPEGKFLRNAAIVLGGAVAGHHIAKKTGKKHGALVGGAGAVAAVLAMPGGDVKVKKGTKLDVRLGKDLKIKKKD